MILRKEFHAWQKLFPEFQTDSVTDKTLTRGYSITEKDNEIIKSVKQLKENDKIKIRFQDGEKNAQIIK